MTQQDFIKLFAKLCVAFSREYSPEQCEMYYAQLKDFPEEEIGVAMGKSLKVCKFFPTVADIYDSIPKHYHRPAKLLEEGNRVPMPQRLREMIGKIGRRV